MTQYVATRYYRAFELLLFSKSYTSAIDMWSIGVIFAEVYLRKILFPGSSQIKQLQLIIETLGTPSEEEVKSFMGSVPFSYQQLIKEKVYPKKSIREAIPNAPNEAVDLIDHLLDYNIVME